MLCGTWRIKNIRFSCGFIPSGGVCSMIQPLRKANASRSPGEREDVSPL
jgi:hypothetical protein